MRVILAFENTRAVIAGEKAIASHGVAVKVIPSPVMALHNCGMALVVDSAVMDTVRDILSGRNIKFDLYEE